MRRFLIGIAFSVASLALLGRLIDWSTTLAILETADLTLIALAITCLIVSLAVKTLRWRFLLPADAPVTTPRLYRILHISFLLNNVLPARLGDVARVAMTSRQPGMRVGSVLSSMLTERVTDTVTLLTCFVVISPFLPIPDQYVDWLHWAWYAIAAMVAAPILFALARKWSPRFVPRIRLPSALSRSERLRDEARSFRDGFRQLFVPRRLVQIWGSSMVAWAGAFAINFLLLRALGIDAPLTVAVLLTCVTNFAMLIPSSPGYIGVFHAAATFALIPFDVDYARAFSFAIIAHLVNVLPVSILGAMFLLAGRESLSMDWRPRRKAAVKAEGPSL